MQNKVIDYTSSSYYFKKFNWFFLLTANFLLLLVIANGANLVHAYSILHLENNSILIALKGILSAMSTLILFFVIKKDVNNKLFRIIKIINLVFIVIITLDLTLLKIISIIFTVSKLDKNPVDFVESMIYMLLNSKEIWLSGILGTLKLALLGTVIGFIMALLLVFMRVSVPEKRNKSHIQLLKLIGSTFAKIYITVIRGTPMMVQILIIYYAGFKITKANMPNASISEINVIWSFFIAGLITVSLNTAAYLAEVLRGGIESLDKGQSEAARSLGLGEWQTMMKIVFPQAIKNSIPAIGNEFIINIKDTAVFNVIGVSELMYVSSTVSGIYFKQLEVYTSTAIIYLILTMSMTKLLAFISTKMGSQSNKGLPSSN